MATVRQDAAPFRKEDLLSIEKTLYAQKEDELVARKIVRPNFNHPPYASEIGYDWYSREGSAKLLAAGANANDVPFVTEKMGRVTMPVYDLVTGIKYTKSERLAVQARQALGKGAPVQLDMLRVETARRFVGEGEDKLFFVGNANFKVPGILNKSGITSEDVAQGATGADATAKKLWSNKTPTEILKDLMTAKTAIETSGIFSAKILVVSPKAFLQLQQPYSAQNPIPLLQWLQGQGAYFTDVVKSRYMLSANNGLSADAFALLDNSPELIELMIPQELELGEPIFDMLGTSEQLVGERIAGTAIRHPASIYVGKGI